MSDSSSVPISGAEGMEAYARINARLEQESKQSGVSPVHHVVPFTVPREDGTLEASPSMQASQATGGANMASATGSEGTTRRIRQRPQQGAGGVGGEDQGQYHDPQEQAQRRERQHMGAATGGHRTGTATKRSFTQRLQRALLPTILGSLWLYWFDAFNVLVFRTDPRIKSHLLTFSLLCLVLVFAIFLYLEFVRPRIRGKPTVYVNWEKEFLYPIRIATLSLVVGSIGANIALWPVWHLWTGFVLIAAALVTMNVLGLVL
ncbi:hypothetical protein DFQ26_003969 [Actinomortierella ambigua]|nr:hypothetical protein DFQ26_003969 [Actinomortierella ambigua]